MKQKISLEAERTGALTVADRLTRPHPLIADWMRDRRERQARSRRERDPWRSTMYAIADFSTTDRCRHRVLHALFRALERRGAVIFADEHGRLSVKLDGEVIPFELREKLRQVTRPLTLDEKRWETWNTSGLRQELQPTGLLQFTITAWTEEPVRKRWLETDTRPIDPLLPVIVGTFVVLAPVLAELRRQREEAALRFAEQQRLADQERQRRREDDNRWRRFLEIAADRRQAVLAREFIAALRIGGPGTGELIMGRGVTDWLDWAEAKVAEMDPVGKGAEAVFGDLARISPWTRFD